MRVKHGRFLLIKNRLRKPFGSKTTDFCASLTVVLLSFSSADRRSLPRGHSESIKMNEFHIFSYLEPMVAMSCRRIRMSAMIWSEHDHSPVTNPMFIPRFGQHAKALHMLVHRTYSFFTEWSRAMQGIVVLH